jgi:uncharacterized membrane protein
MAHMIIGIFDNARGAQRAAAMLQDAGLELDDLSVLSRHDEGSVNVTSAEDLSSGQGATLGAVWGGIIGLGSLLIPGVGPIVAGGALASALTGAGVGAVTGAAVGGIAAALIHIGGISEAEAKEYEALVHAGKTLVAAKVPPEKARSAHRILIKAGAESVEGDTAAPAVTAAPTARVTTYDAEGRRVEHAPE